MGCFTRSFSPSTTAAAWTIWTGSANAATQAFSANEELMLRARGAVVAPLIGYLAYLKNSGKPCHASDELPPNSVRAWLRDGRMDLRRDGASGLRLPIEIRTPGQEKTTAPPGHVSARGNRSFDIAEALGVPEEDDARSCRKRLSVATCYGLGAPRSLCEEVEADRQSVKERREAILARLWVKGNAAGAAQDAPGGAPGFADRRRLLHGNMRHAAHLL